MQTKLLTPLGMARDARGLEITTSRMARINEWETCSTKDVVLVKSEEESVGQITFFVSVNDPTSAAEHAPCGVAHWRWMCNGRLCSTWRCSNDVALVMVDEIACSLIWAHSADGTASVLSNARL